MPDPYELFKASPRKHSTLKALWPEMHDLLAGHGARGSEQGGPAGKPPVPCCLMPCASQPSGTRPRATGRAVRWGAPACADCIRRNADRPGGWSLDLKEHHPR
jgi:hypothetical protein